MATSSQSGSTLRVASAQIARIMRDERGAVRTVALEPAHGRRLEVDGAELSLVIDTATWRHDIPMWRWTEAPDGSMPSTWAEPDFDDRMWRTVPHLHPVITARASAPSWFRARITIPGHVRGQAVTIVLGGLDGQDWSNYRVVLEGIELDAWKGSGSIREPRRITLEPDSAAYAQLTFDTPMLLAVRCEGLEREVAGMVAGEREHHYFTDWLIDSFVAAGEPTRTLRAFSAIDVRQAPDETWLEIDLRSDDMPTLVATVRHAAEGSLLHKTVTIRNEGPSVLNLLDVVTEDWSGSFGDVQGGRGQPILLGNLFAGIEHPAAVSLTDQGRVAMLEMPGTSVAPGGTWQSQPVIIGGGGQTPAVEAFRDYLVRLRERPSSIVRVYSALGWYDFTNPADPLPELTAEIVEENLSQLRELREAGAGFDVYMLDDWWDWADLSRFRAGAFPNGHAPIKRAIEAEGMRAGIWWASTRAAWSEKDAPDVSSSWANDPEFGGTVELAGGEWRWLEEFTNLMIGEQRFCLASEPYRSHYLAALPALVADLDAQLLKIDCAVLHCTSSAHDHRPGRYSTHAMVDSLIELLERCRAASGDLRTVWYWGFRSPWFLRFGDALFDKGLLMEAATVSSAPAPTVRQSLTTNVDEAIRHARTLPLRLQDSLGIWLGDVAWCNRIGTEEWREAMLVDIARGADLLQLWGDLTLLSGEERSQMGAIFSWLERQGLAAAESIEIGGDPWLGQAYGYVRPGRDGLIVTLVNPDWRHAEVTLPVSLPGWPEGDVSVVECYPAPGRLPSNGGEARTFMLAPFEVRVVEIAESSQIRGDIPLQPTNRTVRPTVELDLSLDGPMGWIHLPDVHRGDVIYISQRLERDAQWAYQPQSQALLKMDVTLDDLAVRMTTIPSGRDRNGPGSPWVLHRIPAGPAWSGRDLRLTITDTVPGDLVVHSQALLVDAWWMRHRRIFRDLLGEA